MCALLVPVTANAVMAVAAPPVAATMMTTVPADVGAGADRTDVNAGADALGVGRTGAQQGECKD